MVLVLTAPFRTDLNLDSKAAVDQEPLVSKLLSTSINATKRHEQSGMAVSSQWPAIRAGNLRYASLKEDYLPRAVTPLFSISYAPTVTDLAIAEHLGGFSATLTSCRADYFNNTLAILCIELDLDASKQPDGWINQLDAWSTELCALVIGLIKPLEYRIISDLNAPRSKLRSKVFIHRSNFKAFFDRAESAAVELRPHEELLWVNRILATEGKPDSCEELYRWTQHDCSPDETLKLGHCTAMLCVGNSLVFGRFDTSEKSALVNSLICCTYYYALFDIINRNLRILQSRSNTERRSSALGYERMKRLRTTVDLLSDELSDLMFGVQGSRRRIVEHLMAIWRQKELVNLVQKRADSAGRVIASAFAEQQRRYSKYVEAVLAAIGGVALLDFVVNLFSFASDSTASRDSIIGLVDLAGAIAPDAALYIGIGLILALLLAVSRSR